MLQICNNIKNLSYICIVKEWETLTRSIETAAGNTARRHF